MKFFQDYFILPAASMRWVKIGSRESFPFAVKASGWNCTPMMHSAPSFSMASTTPSSDKAEIMKPGATSLTA